MEFIINIEGMSQVRMTQRNKYINEKAQQYLAWKKEVGWILKQQFKGKSPFIGSLEISGKFYLSLSRYNRCDLSNLIKAIEDAGQGILYRNDKQIKKYNSWQMIPVREAETKKIIFEVNALI